AIAAAVLALSVSQAFAHAELVSSTPAANATVAAPTRIVMHFGEALEGKLSGGEITSAQMMMAGKMVTHVMKIEGVKASLDPADHKTLILTLDAPLGAGTYKVAWHAVSTDTHRETGTFTFTVR
ncbi:MAG: copper homeostasis periplasmic binding protein CopC, partial [Alphaproteobacteria bacterium]